MTALTAAARTALVRRLSHAWPATRGTTDRAGRRRSVGSSSAITSSEAANYRASRCASPPRVLVPERYKTLETQPAPLRLLFTAIFVTAALAILFVISDLTRRALAIFPAIPTFFFKTFAHLAVGFLIYCVLIIARFALIEGIIFVLPRIPRLVGRSSLLTGLAVLVLSAVVLGSYSGGGKIGEEISHGNTDGLADTLPLRWLLDVQADRVDIIWLVEKATCGNISRNNVIYLGGADGTIILYYPDTRSVCRTPTGSLQIMSRPESTGA